MVLSLRLTGAKVLHETMLQDTALSIEAGQIVEMSGGREVDLSDFLIFPGIVDTHGDAFEKHLAPRRGAMKDVDQGLIAAEAEIASNGITTAVLAQFYSWEGGMRGPEFAEKVFAARAEIADRVGTDLRAQLRFEIGLLDHYAAMQDFIQRHAIQYVALNDHLPHDEIASGKRPQRLAGQALRVGKNPDRHWEDLQAMHAAMPRVPAALDRLCAALSDKGVSLGSHDDTTPEDRATWRRRGVTISEFPETLAAAEAAHSAGEPVILGAPNVVRGGSHKGNISAIELISMGLCDALASDYHYPSLKRAAFLIADAGICSLAQAWELISSRPAAILGLNDRGSLVPGARADLVILDARNRDVVAAIASGEITYMKGVIAQRLIN
ncbi:MAG: alpha-D-ribose 1-methylphosphonate 5-triphosphate diphosphatase [Pseudomonadota bacterium]